MLKRVTFTFLLLVISVPLAAQNKAEEQIYTLPPTVDELLKWHEVFIYEVRYSFFKLGEVKIEIVSPAQRSLDEVEDTLYNGVKSYHLKTVITSSGVPFVGDERNRYSSVFTVSDSSFKALTFWTDNVDENEPNTSRYTFDYEKGKVYGYVKEENKRDTLQLERPATAGHLLFYMGRLRAGTHTTVHVPVYINLKKKEAVITHTTEKQMREVDAFDHPVMTFFTHGDANFDGPFGFSGEFEAWYLVGDMRLPIEAAVDVWIGDVQIRLIDYKKDLRND